ncbi:MAG: hypothetical protein H6R05_975 [Burkholderiaceae bacterium]|nr:hypothetical protein [Burkholderiaceae bacterium]
MMPVSIKPVEVALETESLVAPSTPPLVASASPTPEFVGDASALAQMWVDMVAHMGLKAFAGQLARQSELVSLSEAMMTLRCEKLSLATDDNALNTLRSALKNYFTQLGQVVPALKVEVAEIGQVRYSPQKISAKQRDDSLASAKQAVQQHPTIAAIVREFDGMILPNSIKPD